MMENDFVLEIPNLEISSARTKPFCFKLEQNLIELSDGDEKEKVKEASHVVFTI